MAIASFLGSIYVLWEYIQGFKCSKWPSTTGIIVQSKIAPIQNNNKEQSPFIYYQYIVNGKEYISRRLSMHLAISVSNKKADILLEKYPLEKQVTVKYHPLFHRVSVLEVGSKQPLIHLFMLIIMLLFFSISMVAILFPGYSPVFELIMLFGK